MILVLATILVGVVIEVSLRLYTRHIVRVNPVVVDALKRQGLDPSDFNREMAFLFGDSKNEHPYRWYSLIPNYRGRYVTTDEKGFRIDRATINTTIPKIGFFGGSTMFSTRTAQDGSIPECFNRMPGRGLQALNFGLGYYSSTAELTTFIEVVRREPLQYAVFYDGVNEIARYIELLQGGEKKDQVYSDVLGFRPQINEQLVTRVLRHSYVYRFISERVHRTIPRNRNANVMMTPEVVEAHADNILRIYKDNIKTINAVAEAYGVRTLFFWQPDLVTTKKLLSEYERKVRDDPALEAYRFLALSLQRKIRTDNDLGRYSFFDISNALDGLSDETHFFDPYHVTADANRVIAVRISELLERSIGPRSTAGNIGREIKQ